MPQFGFIATRTPALCRFGSLRSQRALRRVLQNLAIQGCAAFLVAFTCSTIPAQQPSEAGTKSSESSESKTTAEPAAPAASAIRIVKLLWKTQSKSAATALERALATALERDEFKQLAPQLLPLVDRFRETQTTPTDPRYVASLISLALTGDAASRTEIPRAASNESLTLAQRELLLRTWLTFDSEVVWQYGRQLFEVPASKTASEADAKQGNAWTELVANRLLQINRGRAAEMLLANWKTLAPTVQVASIEPLTQQADSMRLLVEAIGAGTVSKDLLNTNQLLKWYASDDAALKEKLVKIWGHVRAADDQARKDAVRKTLELLRSGKHGDPTKGEATFKRVCIQCHRLHGEGIDVGPEITSNGRGSFDQLVSNVLDPSLVIGEAFQAKNVLTTDGRVLSGLVVAQDEKRITLKIQGGKTVELDREEDIEEMKSSTKSLMPDGLEQQMSEQELTDLFAYLSLSKPLTAPDNTTIPGTPASLVPE